MVVTQIPRVRAIRNRPAQPLAARRRGETALCVRAQDVAPRLGAARRFPRAQKPAPILPPSLRDKGRAFRRGLLDQSLCGFLHRVAGRGLRLQAVEIIGGLLRVAGGGEDRPLVVLQDREPRRDIGGVVVAGFRRDAKIGAEKRRADFRDLS